MRKLLFAALLAACVNVEEPVDNVGINQYVSSLGMLKVEPESPKMVADCENMCPPEEQDGDMSCSYTRYKQTSRFDQFVALQPNSSALWVGNVLLAEQAAMGLLVPIKLDLAPVTFSISLENLRASPAGTMWEPSLSEFREVRNAILARGINGSVPAAIDLSISKVHSESQVGFALGAGVNWPSGGKISGSFDFMSRKKSTKMLVDFTQAYYTVDIDAPKTPSQFFAKYVSTQDVKDAIPSPPVYIQSITYGRRVIFTVQSEADEESVEMAIKAAYDGVKAGANVDVDLEKKKILDQSSIYAFVLGGSGEDAVGAVAGFDGIIRYIQQGGNYGKDSVGAPIAYKMAYLDNTPTQLAFTTDYAEKVCVKNRGTITASLDSIQHVAGYDSGDEVEIYGTIGVMVPTLDTPVMDCDSGNILGLWYLDYTQYLRVPKNGTWKPPTPIDSPFEGAAMGNGQNICIYAQIIESGRDEWFGTDRETVLMGKVVPFSGGWSGIHSIYLTGEGDLAFTVSVKVSFN